MRLTAKLVVALILATCVVLMAYGRVQVREQRAANIRDIEEDLMAVARLFRPTIARAWRVEGRAAAMYLTEYTESTLQSERQQSKVTMRWVWLIGETTATHQPHVARWRLLIARAGLPQVARRIDPRGEPRLYAYVPVPVPEGLEEVGLGALEVSESLAPVRRRTVTTSRRILLTTLLLVGVCSALALGIGGWLVGKPVRELAEAARRIGAGDLSARVRLRQHDELGVLAREMNSMVTALAQARESLAEETEARIRALEQIRHADRLATVGKLAAGIAHELGTPLAVVSGRAKLIADGTATGETVSEYAASIHRQADRMAAIIRQLLDFARRRRPTASPQDLRAVARSTVSLLESLAKKKRVDLQLEESDESVLAIVDGSQIQQVLTNLIVNAAQAMPSGGTVTIATRTERGRPPDVPGAELSNHATILVTDEGAGIAAADLPRIFEPFYTTKEVGDGTGLGLSVAYGIVREHGGWINVTSEPGVGTTFTVFLPSAAVS